MKKSSRNTFENIFSNCRRILGIDTWERVAAALEDGLSPEAFPLYLEHVQAQLELPPHIVDLARIEAARHDIYHMADIDLNSIDAICVNPAFRLLPVAWRNLSLLMTPDADPKDACPKSGEAFFMIWRHWKTGAMHAREAAPIDLLALKLTAEQIDPVVAAREGGRSVREMRFALDRGVQQGFLAAPRSRIRRTTVSVSDTPNTEDVFRAAEIFTLQWHLTQACDLHCRHCYDRSDRIPLSYADALAILDDFESFCHRSHVAGQVTFTGGNPMLYPHFDAVYAETVKRGFGVAVLGNPTPSERIKEMVRVGKPHYFQISLEGLAEYNDYIRGPGHFERSLMFLDQLRSLDIYTMVMLTLTRDNLDQVLPLATLLTGRADFFTFNRLSTVGEGAALSMAEPEAFAHFLEQYEAAARQNSILGLKDNLLNIIREEKVQPLFGGCTGFGCGAAFNFVALLPDGEVHACRKFPSRIGNVFEKPLAEIYHSQLAAQYRRGPAECRDCRLNPVCRGCLAVAYSYGKDIFIEKDPFCFVSN